MVKYWYGYKTELSNSCWTENIGITQKLLQKLLVLSGIMSLSHALDMHIILKSFVCCAQMEDLNMFFFLLAWGSNSTNDIQRYEIWFVEIFLEIFIGFCEFM